MKRLLTTILQAYHNIHLFGPSLSCKIWKLSGGAKIQLYVIWVKKNSNIMYYAEW